MSLWKCLCDCGKEAITRGNALTQGKIRSCGCLLIKYRENCRESREAKAIEKRNRPPKLGMFKHGHSGGNETPEYRSWRAMKGRCLNPNTEKYAKYGALGVTVCDRWLGKDGFSNFLADMGERPPGTTLGRFGDVGNYEPGNVKWMTSAEQRENWKSDRNMGCIKNFGAFANLNESPTAVIIN